MDSNCLVDFNQMISSHHFEVQNVKFEQNLKMAAACDLIYLTFVAMETN